MPLLIVITLILIPTNNIQRSFFSTYSSTLLWVLTMTILGTGMVVHTCNLSYWRAEMGKIMLQGQPRQKVTEIQSQQTRQVR
jgi:hypothetical protein